MSKRFYIVLKLCSLALLCGLFFNTIAKLDLAATKNDHLIGFKKAEIDTTNNIEEVRQKAKQYLTSIQENRRNESSIATGSLLLFVGIFAIELLLWVKGRNKS